MANQTQTGNPFAEERPQLVHLEKDQSHYEYCRMQMHEIDAAHRRTFFLNLVICIAVSLLAIFQIYIGGFSITGGAGPLRADLAGMDRFKTVLTFGIVQILVSMVIMLLGYLAWANFRILNIILTVWYFLVTFIGIISLDYATGIVGAIGLVIYIFAVRENQKEAVLAEMEGYPSFQERFDIQKSDIVVATLMAHKGEHRTKSTLFTTDYSLRRMKKRKAAEEAQQKADQAGEELAESLKKHIDEAKGNAPAAKQDTVKCYLTRMDTELQCIAADQDLYGEEFPFRLPLTEGSRVCVREGVIYVDGEPYMPDSLDKNHQYKMRIAESGSRIRIAMSSISEAEYAGSAGSAETEEPFMKPLEDVVSEKAEAAAKTAEAVTETAEEAVQEAVSEVQETAEKAVSAVKETAEQAVKAVEKPAQSGGQQGGKNKRKKRR